MSNLALVKKVSDRMVDPNPISPEMHIHLFDWVDGVGMYGLMRASEVYGLTEYVDFMKNWIEVNKEQAYAIDTVNGTAVMLSVIDMYGLQEEALCRHIGDYVLNVAERCDNGALEHTVTDPAVTFTQQMWADTMFMSCIFLAKLGALTGDIRYTNEVIRQVRLHHQYLKDAETGLFFHGYSCQTGDNLSAIRWGRANAWITAATVEILEILPDDFKGREDILRSLREQVAAYAKFQRENGMIGTVIDQPDSYDETSATAGMAYGVCRGIKDGYIDTVYTPVYEKAMAAVIGSIDEEGYVNGVSWGTPIMPDAQSYKEIKQMPMLYGQALTVLMLSEQDRK